MRFSTPLIALLGGKRHGHDHEIDAGLAAEGEQVVQPAEVRIAGNPWRRATVGAFIEHAADPDVAFRVGLEAGEQTRCRVPRRRRSPRGG